MILHQSNTPMPFPLDGSWQCHCLLVQKTERPYCLKGNYYLCAKELRQHLLVLEEILLPLLLVPQPQHCFFACHCGPLVVFGECCVLQSCSKNRGARCMWGETKSSAVQALVEILGCTKKNEWQVTNHFFFLASMKPREPPLFRLLVFNPSNLPPTQSTPHPTSTHPTAHQQTETMRPFVRKSSKRAAVAVGLVVGTAYVLEALKIKKKASHWLTGFVLLGAPNTAAF